MNRLWDRLHIPIVVNTLDPETKGLIIVRSFRIQGSASKGKIVLVGINANILAKSPGMFGTILAPIFELAGSFRRSQHGVNTLWSRLLGRYGIRLDELVAGRVDKRLYRVRLALHLEVELRI